MECDAAVGILLRGCQVLMIRRSPDPRDPFFWDVSFPGGAVEEFDSDCLDTALREVSEEVGVELSRAQLAVELPVISPLSVRMRVKPFIFRVDNVRAKPGPEVERMFWLDLREVKEGYALIPRRGTVVRTLYCCGYVIWGMSYRLLKLIMNLLRERCDPRRQRVLHRLL
ncbi:MAG TPA: NUDIX domain-containing protein [Candidatus Korarchaeota archaeon]|nr:NUDIX domain-containing protein [Candidatus Korarchaeota archaeon]